MRLCSPLVGRAEHPVDARELQAMLGHKRGGVKRPALDKLLAAHVGFAQAEADRLAEEEEQVTMRVGSDSC